MAFKNTRLILAVATSLVLVACGDRPAPGAPTDAAAPTGTAATPATPAAPLVATALQEYAVPTGLAEGGSCALDAINGAADETAAVAAGAEVMFSGWMVGADLAVPAQAQLVLVGPGRSYATAIVAGGDRGDVATALNSEAARMSGYNALVSLAGVEPGEYQVSIVQGDANPLRCALNKRVTVSGS